MKQSDTTYEDKLSELRMDLSNPNSNNMCFIFVEGQTDVRLFRKFFDLDKCKVERIPGGNVKLEECVLTLLPSHNLIVAIRDADFLRVSNTPLIAKPNIILTDYHDVEMTILYQSKIFDNLMSEYAETVSPTNYNNIKEYLLNFIFLISLIKLLNVNKNLSLSFNFGFQDLLDFQNDNFDLNSYVNRIFSKSDNPKISEESLFQELNQVSNTTYDLYQITNGHDIAHVLAKFFNTKHQIARKKSLTADDIESDLRLLFNEDNFKNTQIYSELKKWENANNTTILKNF